MADDGISIKIDGLDETVKRLYNFSDKLANKVVGLSLRSGANFMLKNMRAAAPKSQKGSGGFKAGRLRRSMSVKNSRLNRPRVNGKVGVYIKLNPGKSRTDGKGAWYWLFVEADHYNHGKAGRTRPANATITKGNYFISSTYKKTAKRATQLIIKDIEVAGEKLAERV